MEPTMTRDVYRLPPGSWRRAAGGFAAMAGIGLVLAGVGFVTDRTQFFHSYLTAYLYVLTLALGCLFFVMFNHLARSGWAVAVRRFAEVGASTIPVLALLFLPLLAGLGDLFHWTHQDAVEHDELLQHKQGFLNVPFWLIRAVIYFGIWTILARVFLKQSVAQDESRDPAITVRLQRLAAPGILLFAFTLTFMYFDWVMSLDPHWFSTIFGVYGFAGSTVSSFAFMAVVSLAVRRSGHLRQTLKVDHFQDLGRWMFAFCVFWAYISFSQFFLIWYGNLPEETIFYVDRLHGSWKPFSYFLVVGHFAIPFVLLMSRFVKRRPALVALIAVWILFIHYVDLYWLVMPNLHHDGVALHWLDVACVVGLAGVFLTMFVRGLTGRALVPAGDPRLPESLALEHLY